MANYLLVLLSAGLGWALGGAVGGIIGSLVGGFLFAGDDNDPKPATPPDNPSSGTRHGAFRNTGTQQDINVSLMVLFAAIMKADGVINRSELAVVKRFLLVNYGEERGKELLQTIRQIAERDIPIDDICRQIKVNTDYATRYQMLDFLFSIGGADGEFHASELALLSRIATGFGISRQDLVSIHARHLHSGGGSRSDDSSASHGAAHGKDPYRVLGIDSSATDDEVKKAYRRMVKRYHPDTVANMSEEIQRNAAEQMKEINDAYASIKASRDSLK